jgi:hypothetical protein
MTGGGLLGFGNLIFPLGFALLGGSFIFWDMGPSSLYLVFPLFWVLWFIYDWQGLIDTFVPVFANPTLIVCIMHSF